LSLSISKVAQPQEIGLCFIQSNPLQLPSLNIPRIMQEMNYGCGSTLIMNDPTLEDRLFAKFRYTYSRKNDRQQFTG
jgi:hypothetical protein